MSMTERLDRRGFGLRLTAGLASLLLSGCGDEVSERPWVRHLLDKAEDLNYWLQRRVLPHHALAREYDEADLSPQFRANGSTDPEDEDYRRLAANGFADWGLEVGGLVERPQRFSLADLRTLPSRTQITRHDCVEGWSCIGKWTGTPLAALLQRVGVRPEARFVMFHCADTMEDSVDRYYESIGLGDAFHPQTILAYDMNGAPLPVAHGAPLRVRVERQLGYKMAKYVMAIELVESFSHIGRGHGGFWEDRGYEWYAGI
jgi:DMSO/TMAO reductase YedYZ molybdopterin-dependent catalytic subunit